MRSRTLSSIALSTMAATTLTIGVSTSSVGAAADDATTDSAHAERVCNRVDTMIQRIRNTIDRINGDETVRGSLLWLDRRIANAVENDRDDLAEVLRNRRAARQGYLPVLDDRLATLADLDARCAEAGL